MWRFWGGVWFGLGGGVGSAKRIQTTLLELSYTGCLFISIKLNKVNVSVFMRGRFEEN